MKNDEMGNSIKMKTAKELLAEPPDPHMALHGRAVVPGVQPKMPSIEAREHSALEILPEKLTQEQIRQRSERFWTQQNPNATPEL